ncbi:hypothetical protein CLCAR_2401 [Clostridium carboxidivorans P7]|nr:hypothetical protein CLCAR_2401 [Clostridium carboxidivorans P7]
MNWKKIILITYAMVKLSKEDEIIMDGIYWIKGHLNKKFTILIRFF